MTPRVFKAGNLFTYHSLGTVPQVEAAKACSKCHTWTSLSGFHVNRATPDGKSPWCKVCVKAYNQQCKERNHQATLARKMVQVVPVLKKAVQDIPTSDYPRKGVKYCRKCDQTKLHGDFHKTMASADGLASYCKACKKGIYEASKGKGKQQEQVVLPIVPTPSQLLNKLLDLQDQTTQVIAQLQGLL